VHCVAPLTWTPRPTPLVCVSGASSVIPHSARTRAPLDGDTVGRLRRAGGVRLARGAWAFLPQCCLMMRRARH
jgi:hypothetical protein